MLANHVIKEWATTNDQSGEPYGCPLEGQPGYLVPERLRRSLRDLNDETELQLSQDCWLDAGTPESALSGVGAAIYRDPWTLWVRHPGTQVAAPYLLDEESMSWISVATSGARPPAGLSVEARFRLTAIGALVEPGRNAALRSRWQEWLRPSESFVAEGFTTVGGLIPPFHVAALRARYRRLVRTNALRLGDNQCEHRFVAHNDPAARLFHHQLTPAVSWLVGEPVKPSYSYLVAYQPGATLPVHRDRAQCTYSLSVCLDYSPEPPDQTPWPLLVRLRRGEVAVFQAIGDAVLYRGRDLAHGRSLIPANHSAVSMLLHYVAVDFDGPLD
jgi:hypothetical protein